MQLGLRRYAGGARTSHHLPGRWASRSAARSRSCRPGAQRGGRAAAVRRWRRGRRILLVFGGHVTRSGSPCGAPGPQGGRRPEGPRRPAALSCRCCRHCCCYLWPRRRDAQVGGSPPGTAKCGTRTYQSRPRQQPSAAGLRPPAGFRFSVGGAGGLGSAQGAPGRNTNTLAHLVLRQVCTIP